MSDEARAAEVFGALRERIDRGERVDPDEVIRAHPELAEPLRRQFAAMRLAEGLMRVPAADATAMVGRSLGPWRLTAVLGKGGMGTVFAATRDAGRAAVKVMHPHLAARDGFVERFLREADAGRRVRHPNVVATLDAGTTQADGAAVHYLVMEQVEGRTLRAMLAESGRLPEALCRHVGREAARALAAIHAAGFVHRDVKPENVIVTPDHVVKLMDLGVARLVHDDLHVSQTGAFVGSVRYAAPEQFGFRGDFRGTARGVQEVIPRSPEGAKGDGLDGRADLYALGLTLYESVVGAHPFPDDDFHVVLKRQLTDVPRRAGEVNPQLSPFLEELLAQLLAKDRERRPASASLVADVLDAGEESAWWRDRSRELRDETRRPLRRMRVPRETALYGRDAELALLRSLYDRASEGDGQVALLEGEAGIGKSRLVDEFVGQLTAAGEDVDFLFGSYPPGGAATASGAFSVAYRQRLGEDETSIRSVLPQTPLLVPAFSALLRGDAAPAGAEALTKDSLQAVFVHATRSFAAARPTIVLIDDLHFAPDEGRALFAALALAAPGHRILLVGAARPGLDAAWIAQIERLGHATRLVLPRLSPKDLVRLLADSLKSTHLAEELAGKIAAKSDGNPFFVFEILRGLREGQFLTRKPDGTWATTRFIAEIQVPSSVVELMQARVSDLDRADRNVLEAAACIGFEFDPSLVGDVLRMERIPLLQALGAIEKSHRLVRSVGRKFVFDHHQVMEVLYAGLSEPLREEYHAAIGLALEARAAAAARDPAQVDGASCVELAEHLSLGGRGGHALRYLDAALSHLSASGRHDTSARLAGRILAVPGLVDGRARAELLLRRAGSFSYMAKRDAERVALDEACSLADEDGDASLRARTRNARARFFHHTTQPPEAERESREALDIARAGGDRAQEIVALRTLGLVAMRRGRLEEAKAAFTRDVELAREAGDLVHEAAAVGNLGNALNRMGLPEEGGVFHARQIELAAQLGDRRGEVEGRGNYGGSLVLLGRLDEARPHIERQFVLARAGGYRIAEATAAGNLAMMAAREGRLAEARSLSERVLASWRELGQPYAMTIALLHVGTAHADLASFVAARERLVEGLALARASRAPGLERGILLELARLDDAEDDAAACERRLEEALACSATDAEIGGVVYLRALHKASRGRSDEAAGDLASVLAMPRIGDGGPDMRVLAAAWFATLRTDAAPQALAEFALHRERLGFRERMVVCFLLWRVTGDRAHLEEANRRLETLLAHAPPECRTAMVTRISELRDIVEAARANGL